MYHTLSLCDTHQYCGTWKDDRDTFQHAYFVRWQSRYNTLPGLGTTGELSYDEQTFLPEDLHCHLRIDPSWVALED